MTIEDIGHWLRATFIIYNKTPRKCEKCGERLYSRFIFVGRLFVCSNPKCPYFFVYQPGIYDGKK